MKKGAFYILTGCFVLSCVYLSCSKSNASSGSTANNGGGNNTIPPGAASSNHMAAGTTCGSRDTSSNISLSGYTFYVDSGYVRTGDGIVSAISGSPQIQFSDGSYRVVQDSSSYFPSYLSGNNTYQLIGDTLVFNSYTKYIITAYTLCQKTLVYDMIQYTSYGLYNRLVLYRNL